MKRIFVSSIFTLSVLGACVQSDAIEDGVEDVIDPVVGCLASDPSEGYAWIDKMPGVGATPTLHFNFQVKTGNEGDEYGFTFQSAQESSPPSYVYEMALVNPGTDRVESNISVSYREPEFAEPELRSVVITCGGELFYEIEPVEITH